MGEWNTTSPNTKEELIAYLIENISGSTFTVNQDAPSDLSR